MIVVRFHRELLLHKRHIEPFLTATAKKTRLDSVNECVFQLWFKKKYIIVKSKTAVGGLKCIFNLLGSYSSKNTQNIAEDNLYRHFVEYFWGETRGFTFRVKLILNTSNHFDLLKCEQECLWNAQKDPNCLNNTTDAYIPVYREETGSNGWINKGSLLTFLKWKGKTRPLQVLETSAI